MTDHLNRLLDAALPHVAFDGWSEEVFSAARTEAGLSREEARAAAPRGAFDLAVAFHRRGDQAMVERLAVDLAEEGRIRDRVAAALKIRIEVMTDREAVRRATALFALPNHAADGGKLVWETADHVWTALGDTSRDGNWYSKRTILAGVWSATVLYWLGDDTAGYTKTADFIDRRIDDVMRFEKLKHQMRGNALTKPLMDFQDAIFDRLRAPGERSDLPGRWSSPS